MEIKRILKVMFEEREKTSLAKLEVLSGRKVRDKKVGKAGLSNCGKPSMSG